VAWDRRGSEWCSRPPREHHWEPSIRVRATWSESTSDALPQAESAQRA